MMNNRTAPILRTSKLLKRAGLLVAACGMLGLAWAAPAAESGSKDARALQSWYSRQQFALVISPDAHYYFDVHYNYTTGLLTAYDGIYNNSERLLGFWLFAREWGGTYHYSVTEGRYTQLMIHACISDAVNPAHDELAAEREAASAAAAGTAKVAARTLPASTGFKFPQVVPVSTEGGYFNNLFYNFNTGELRVDEIANTIQSYPANVDVNEWAGCFLYNYTEGKYTETLILANLTL